MAKDNYKDFPARMSDGRFMTDNRPNCEMNYELRQDMNSYEYRQNLINNAGNIFKKMQEINKEAYKCSNCNGTVVPPPQNKQDCKDGNCKVYENNSNGFGIDQA
tara:strand:- start:624 stop:935 length:312 start_codon:yes stop_codon:yes gene_type:complete